MQGHDIILTGLRTGSDKTRMFCPGYLMLPNELVTLLQFYYVHGLLIGSKAVPPRLSRQLKPCHQQTPLLAGQSHAVFSVSNLNV